jgi:hypothetical protein
MGVLHDGFSGQGEQFRFSTQPPGLPQKRFLDLTWQGDRRHFAVPLEISLSLTPVPGKSAGKSTSAPPSAIRDPDANSDQRRCEEIRNPKHEIRNKFKSVKLK